MRAPLINRPKPAVAVLGAPSVLSLLIDGRPGPSKRRCQRHITDEGAREGSRPVAAHASTRTRVDGVPIPCARRVAAFNRRVTNPILDPIVWYLPAFGRIEHVGRRTGKVHRAPMMA